MGQKQSSESKHGRDGGQIPTQNASHYYYHQGFPQQPGDLYTNPNGVRRFSLPEPVRGHDNVVYINGYQQSEASNTAQMRKKKKGKGKRSKGSSNPGSVHSMYRPYSMPYVVAVDPTTGAPYYYPVGVPMGDPSAHHRGGEEQFVGDDGNENYAGNINRTSTLISTFEDPQQDIVRVGTEPKLSGDNITIINAAATSATNDDNNNNNNNNNNNTNKEVVGDRNRVSTIIIGGETLVPEDNYIIGDEVNSNPPSLLLPGPTRRSEYVTYIKEQPGTPSPPPSPPSPPLEEDLEIQEAEVAVPPEEVEVMTFGSKVSLDRFVEVGDGDENVSRMLIDEDDDGDADTQGSVSTFGGECISLERRAFNELGVEEQMLTMEVYEESGVDVVICYDNAGAEIAGRVRGCVEPADVRVWSASCLDDQCEQDVLLDTARAILGAQVTLLLLTESSARRRQLIDLVCLAQVANNQIHVIAVDDKDRIVEAGPPELNLHLRRLNWTQLPTDRYVPGPDIEALAMTVTQSILSWRTTNVIDEDYGQVSSWAVRHQHVMQFAKQRKAVAQRNMSSSTSTDVQEGSKEEDVEKTETKEREEEVDEDVESGILTATRFWDQTFPQDSSVPWDNFRYQLRSYYLAEMNAELPRACMPPLMETLKGELVTHVGDGKEGQVPRARFVDFCTECGEDQDVWERLCDVARDSQAVMVIFDKESTVRDAAIDGVGNHGNPAVVSGLHDLLKDPDPSTRCKATTSLSRCMLPGDQASFSVLMVALDDPHWTVRRTACLAMARIGAAGTVDRLRRLWRNDPVQHVRHAALAALTNFDGGVKPFDQPPAQGVNKETEKKPTSKKKSKNKSKK